METGGPLHGRSSVFHADDQRVVVWVHLVNGILATICQFLGLRDYFALLDYVRTHVELLPVDANIRVEDRRLMTRFLQVNGAMVPAGFQLDPPNSVGCLVHWRIMAKLIAYLGVVEQETIRTTLLSKDCMGAYMLVMDPRVCPTPLAADSHFHLDRLLKKSRATSLDLVMHRGVPLQFTHLVAVYCYPASWPTSAQRTAIRADPRIHFTFGVHPHYAIQARRHMSALDNLLDSGRTVALGEVGLDYHGGCSTLTRQLQQEVLEEMLCLVVPRKLAVVIHCRDDLGSADASVDCIHIMKRVLPKLTRVHLH